MNWIYKPKPVDNLRKWYNEKLRNDESLFRNFEDFKNWYTGQKKICFYCGLSEEESQEIVYNGVLKSKRFPENGIFKRGENKAYWLEVDRKKAKGKYSMENCVLCCYFCNNDKSDIFDEIEYKEFLKDRIGFLRTRLEQSRFKSIEKIIM